MIEIEKVWFDECCDYEPVEEIEKVTIVYRIRDMYRFIETYNPDQLITAYNKIGIEAGVYPYFLQIQAF